MNIESCCDWCSKQYQQSRSVHPRAGEERKWLCDTCAPKDLPHTFDPGKVEIDSQEFLADVSEAAADALCHFSSSGGPEDHNVSQLIRSLGHYCDREGHDFRALVQTALRQWEEER